MHRKRVDLLVDGLGRTVEVRRRPGEHGAFLMSEFTQVPYVDIVLISIFPAILYFGSVYLLVHIAAVKLGLGRPEVGGAPGRDPALDVDLDEARTLISALAGLIREILQPGAAPIAAAASDTGACTAGRFPSTAGGSAAASADGNS